MAKILVADDATPNDEFGSSFAMSDDFAIVGAPHADGVDPYTGAAYVFTRQDEAWSQTQKLVPVDGTWAGGFGWSVSLDGGVEPVRELAAMVGRELAVGAVNGGIIGGVVALTATVVGGDPVLGVVVLLAMWGNLVIAGFLGSFVPSVMNRLWTRVKTGR